jgi:flagellar L-ring protein precursor FlgH
MAMDGKILGRGLAFGSLLAFSALGLQCGAFCEPPENIRLALNMYSNQRAHQVGDLITIIVNESTSSSKAEALKTSKTATASASDPYFGTAASGGIGALSSALVNSRSSLPLSKANASNNIYSVNAASNFTGSGSASSAETLSVTFTARVVDILANGVMVIRGERKILIKNESVSLVITGLVRTKDIDSYNRVNSTYIADAHIYYENEGEVTRGTKPGYVWRAFQYLNPF